MDWLLLKDKRLLKDETWQCIWIMAIFNTISFSLEAQIGITKLKTQKQKFVYCHMYPRSNMHIPLKAPPHPLHLFCHNIIYTIPASKWYRNNIAATLIELYWHWKQCFQYLSTGIHITKKSWNIATFWPQLKRHIYPGHAPAHYIQHVVTNLRTSSYISPFNPWSPDG